ncbi:hypothetical protein WG66_009141, partial [Moniliophthora roreri]
CWDTKYPPGFGCGIGYYKVPFLCIPPFRPDQKHSKKSDQNASNQQSYYRDDDGPPFPVPVRVSARTREGEKKGIMRL